MRPTTEDVLLRNEDLLTEFAKQFCSIRDTVIESSVDSLADHYVGAVSKRWREAIAGADPELIRSTLIPDIVDEALFALLMAIDNSDLELYMRDPDNGEVRSLADLGGSEMAGEYIGDDDGWRFVHSATQKNSFG